VGIKDYLKYAYIKTLKIETIPTPGEGYALRKGSQWNPILKYPRNHDCFCGSKIKFKKCCLPAAKMAIETQPASLTKALANRVRKK